MIRPLWFAVILATAGGSALVAQTPNSVTAIRIEPFHQFNATTLRSVELGGFSLKVEFDTPPSKTTEVVLVMNTNWRESIPRIDDHTFVGSLNANATKLATTFPDRTYELWVRESTTGLTTKVFLQLQFSTLSTPQPVTASNFNELQVPANNYTLRWAPLSDPSSSDRFVFCVLDHAAVPLLLTDLPQQGDHLDFALAGTDYAYSYIERAHTTQGLAGNGVTKLVTGVGCRTTVPLRLGTEPAHFVGTASNVWAVTGGSAQLLGPSPTGQTVDLIYQWRKHGVIIPGANRIQLDIRPVSLADAGDYTLEITNYKGSAVSNPIYLTIVNTLTPTAPLAAASHNPFAFCVGADGSFYSVDDHTVTRLDRAGNFRIVAGALGVTGYTDGPGATARFSSPLGIACDSQGNLFVADTYNWLIRKITPAGEVSTFAGRPAAIPPVTPGEDRLNYPIGLVFDRAGNLFVADTGNAIIRRFTPDGHSTIYAGQAGKTGLVDGPALSAQFHDPRALTIDADGNLFVGEYSAGVIRRISVDGVVTTLAGRTVASGDLGGQGAATRLSTIYNLAVTPEGFLYGTESGGSVFQLTPARELTYLPISAPTGRHIKGVATDTDGRLYFQDEKSIWQASITPGAPQPSLLAPARAVGSPIGRTAVVGVDATGPSLFYRWKKDGKAIPDATAPRLLLSPFQASDAGTYTVEVGNAAGRLVSTIDVTPQTGESAGKIVNLSVRTRAGTGDETLIAGFVLDGTDSSTSVPMLMRGSGPALERHGVSQFLADPVVTLAPLGQPALATNDDWSSDPAIADSARRLGAFPFPTASRDAALLRQLPRGVYTLQVAGKQATGIAMVEIYDGNMADDGPQLSNVSSRARVGTGDDVLIAGFVISGATSQTVLIRGLGPRLSELGISDCLVDPRLDLYRDGTLLSTNDNWSGAADLSAIGKKIGALPLTDLLSADAALLLTLPAGVYSVVLSGAGDSTGVGLVEVYAVP